MTGKVYLVGAGPGDYELITVKGVNCIKEADVIIYDSLINKKLLSYAKDNVEKIFVGKRAGKHSFNQDEINNLLVQKAKENETVIRLKGGDPFVFGRGGEEAIFLKEHNIEFEIIPGISSSIAAAVYSGIPVTHRDISSSFHVVTGHESSGNNTIDYKVLAKFSGTLVFLMGLGNLKDICLKLIKFGKSSGTPVAVISNGTCLNQKTVIGTLENITNKASSMEMPAVIVIGEVVKLRENIKWFENKPLFGRNVLVTRAKHQSRELAQKIERVGGNAIELPAFKIKPIDNNAQLELTLQNIKEYNWLIFSSTNSVKIFFDSFLKQNNDIRNLGNAKIAAIGESTAKFLERYHIQVDFIPEEYVSESLAKGLKERIKKGEKILIPIAKDSRRVLSAELKNIEAKVDEIILYKKVIPNYQKEELIKAIQKVDSICFASPSSVINCLEIMKEINEDLIKSINAYCIGPITSDKAKELGFKTVKTANGYTIDGLVEILIGIGKENEINL